MEQETVKRSAGRPRKELDLPLPQPDEQRVEHPADAMARIAKEDLKRTQERKEARKLKRVVGYKFNPYTTKPRKQGYGELCLMTFTPIIDRLESTLIANDVPLADGVRLMTMTEEQAKAEFEKCGKQANFGFKRLKLPNKL